MDAFTAKEYASYYLKVLDEHLPLAMDVLADIVHAAGVQRPTTSNARRRWSSKRSRWSRTRRTTWSTSCSPRISGADHPLGRPILGTPGDGGSVHAEELRQLLRRHVCGAQHDHRGGRQRRARARAELVRGVRGRAWARQPHGGAAAARRARSIDHPQQGAGAEPRLPRQDGYHQDHEDRYASYVLNTVLGGSMSSRLFQNVREKRGLAYAVFSGLSAYRDAGLDDDVCRVRQQRGRRVIDVVMASCDG